MSESGSVVEWSAAVLKGSWSWFFLLSPSFVGPKVRQWRARNL